MHPEAEVAAAIATAVRTERERQGLRQDELAFAAGVSKRLVHQVENGKVTTRLDGLAKILQALGLTLTVQQRSLRRVAPEIDESDE